MTVKRLLRLRQALIWTRQLHQDATKNILKSKVPAVNIPKIPFPNFIWDESCERHGDKIAIVSLFFCT